MSSLNPRRAAGEKRRTHKSKFYENVLDLVYPRRCPICHGIAPWGEDICPECREKLPFVTTKRCRKCGKPVEDFETLCDDCKATPHIYDEGMGLLLYNETMRDTMAYLKFKGRREYGAVLGRVLAASVPDKIRRWQPDAVVPVPVHRDKLISRGYNQAEEIARPLAERYGIPLRTDLVVRREKTAAMKALNKKERFQNLKGAFAVPDGVRVPPRILIVDDIYTTGATIDAMSAVLIDNGAAHVYFLTVCIGMGFMVRY
ncbi:MAG: ComF family protein [Lachnospiraceae bacterium]|nr:ComF family protein [Lachnospiraceae bacterium]